MFLLTLPANKKKMDQEIAQNLSRNDSKMTPKWPQNDSKMTPKWPQSDPKVTPKRPPHSLEFGDSISFLLIDCFVPSHWCLLFKGNKGWFIYSPMPFDARTLLRYPFSWAVSRNEFKWCCCCKVVAVSNARANDTAPWAAKWYAFTDYLLGTLGSIPTLGWSPPCSHSFVNSRL